MIFFQILQNHPSFSYEAFHANAKILMSGLQMPSLQMVCLSLCQMPNQSTKNEHNDSRLNGELSWLWNSVYIAGTHLNRIELYYGF